MRRLVAATSLVIALLLAAAAPARAQWPTVLMFHGAPLKAPVLVSGADSVTFGPLFSSAPKPANSPTIADMGDRPYVTVACFWGTAADPAMNGTKPADLRPDMATQHARFFPATGGKPAAMFITSFAMIKNRGPAGPMGVPPPTAPAGFTLGGVVPADALAVLKKLGVQTER